MSLDLTSDFLQNKIGMPTGSKNGYYTFDRFRLDSEKLMLYRDEIEISLPPKVVKTLAVLIEHRGSILSKDELIDRVWADSIVEESNLSQYLYILRKALGAKPDGGSYIETLRRRGYRFTGDVQKIETQPIPAPRTVEPSTATQGKGIERHGNVLRVVDWRAAQPAAAAQPVAASLPSGTNRRFLPLAVIAVAMLLLGIAVTAFVFNRVGVEQKAASRSEMSVVRLTNSAMPLGAAISDDGNYFVYYEPDGDVNRLYLQQVGQSGRLEIASSIDKVFYASTFSRDGRFVYVMTTDRSDGHAALYRIPTIGGPMTKLLDDVNGPVSFSPDGNEMAFMRSSKPDLYELIISDKDGRNERSVLQRRAPDQLGSCIAWSPDGSQIAFSEFGPHGGSTLKNQIFAADLSGYARPMSDESWDTVYRMQWTNDGSGLVFIGTRANEAYSTRRDQVYLLSYPDGKSHRITSDGNRHEPVSLGVTKDGAILAVTGNRSTQIWTMDADGDQTTAFQISKGVADGRAGLCPLPDGRIGYITRTGEDLNILVSNSDGSNPKQLATGSPIVEELRVDPNGRSFVFSSIVDGKSHLFRIDPDGGDLRQLTFGEGSEVDSTISPDGKNVVFGSYLGKVDPPRAALFRIPSEGGEPVQVSSTECATPSYSPDGSMISCIAAKSEAVIVSASDGSEIKRFQLPSNATTNFGTGWAPDGTGLALIINEKEASNIWIYPIKGGKPHRLTSFTSGMIFRFAFAPQTPRLYVARGYPIQDAVLITNYF
jgi:Tol biopolymer transport system component/DNA-binding winged helix-turn-helix (wHTH) protein